MKYTSALACILAIGLSACGSNSGPSVEGKWCSPDGNVTFQPDGKVTMESGGETATGTYTFDGKTVIATRDGPEVVNAVITLGSDGKLTMEDSSAAPLERCK